MTRGAGARVTRRGLLAAGLTAVATLVCGAEIRMVDDAQRELVLPRPAQRIISIAPHLTELLFAAGAGERLVAVTAYSDFPEAARRLPQVGDVRALDLERVLALKPDLVVVWLNGTPARQIDALQRAGVPLFHNHPRRLEDVARALRQFGRLAGTEAVAEPAARGFEQRLADLRVQHAGKRSVSVFYQVSSRPLLTVNDEHLISDAMRLCGGRNVFAALKPLVPSISMEAVLAANPEVIATGQTPGAPAPDFADWRKWPRLAAVAANNLFVLNADLLNRHSPRILDGAQQLCDVLDRVRARPALR